jgi:hypothetical protein
VLSLRHIGDDFVHRRRHGFTPNGAKSPRDNKRNGK